MTPRRFLIGVFVIVAAGALLRTAWLTADPPTRPTVGVVWHDEGAWVHSARNRALWGVWRTDNWNPVFLAPVFTALEYGAFRSFGVGTWQARTVPVGSGLIAIAFLIAGLHASAGKRAALVSGALLATNYVFVMWNRAALMESTMTSLIVVSWAAYATAERAPRWGLVAGSAAALAFFTKASAAFFLAAIVLDAATAIWFGWRREPGPLRLVRETGFREAIWTLIGLVMTAAAIGVFFAVPHWAEYQFYNWQMSVVRKPDYALRALLDRASWLPIVNDFFMWMWPVFAAAAVAVVAAVSRWRIAKPAERLLVLWVLVGLLELTVHDSGNERRYVMFIPAIIALAATLLGASRPVLSAGLLSRRARWLALPLVCGLGYLVAGSALRVLFLQEIHGAQPHPFHRVVTLSAAVAGVLAAAVFLWWASVVAWLGRLRLPVTLGALAVGLTMVGDCWHFAGWARSRQELNYQASLEVGHLLAPGTLVHGKLANGLSLENRIRPIFIGHDFGNYADRLQRDDVRYILTYVSPRVGFESQDRSGMIQEILDHYPSQRIVATFAVDETGGPDRAELIDKHPGSDPRARD